MSHAHPNKSHNKIINCFALTVVFFTILFFSQKSLLSKAYAAGDEQINGFVYEDLNGNGSFDPGTESGLNGTAVNIYQGPTHIGGTTTASGFFSFTTSNSTIAPATPYTLMVTPPVLGEYTYSQGSYSQVLPGLAVDQHYDAGNFGVFNKNFFYGRTFYDRNHDGLRQSTEEPIHSLKVTLETSEGTPISATAYTISGSYGLASEVITPGLYYLHITNMPSSYVFTDQNIGEDDTQDSDVGADARIPITVTYGTNYDNLDIGMYRANVLIRGKVFTDLDHNGIENGADPGVNNIQVSTIDRGTLLSTASTTTDSSGEYQLSLNPTSCAENNQWTESSSYTIECPITAPDGYYQLNFTTGNSCDFVGTEIQLLAASGEEIYRNDCESGDLERNTSYSFLFSTPETSMGTAFLNLQNLSDPFMDGEIYDITLTYINAFIHFENLPSGASFTDSNVGMDDTIDSDVIHPLGDTATIFAGAGDVLENIDAGLFMSSGGGGGCESECGRITIHIFTDTNGNAIQDVGEPDSATGATVTLALGSMTQTDTPDSHGDLANELEANTYTLTVNPPSGAIVTGVSNPTIFTVIAATDISLGSRGIYFPPAGPVNGSGGSAIGSGRLVEAHGVLLYAAPLGDTRSNAKTETQPVVLNPRLPCLVLGGSSAQQFADVKGNQNLNFLSTIIIANNQAHLIHGYGDNNFGPHQSLTRFELLKVALASNCLGASSATAHPNTTFTDVPKDNSELSLVVGEAYAQGIIKGIDGKFFPNKPVSNAEMIKILLAASIYFPNGTPANPLPLTISGVNDPTFAQYVEKAHQLGLFTLSSHQDFDQNKVVERIEMANTLAKFIKVIQANVAVK